jgi:hypothetical protein
MAGTATRIGEHYRSRAADNRQVVLADLCSRRPDHMTFADNPAANAVALTGVGFTDMRLALNCPHHVGAGVRRSCDDDRPTCCHGATIALNGTCTFSVTVLAFSVGDYVNTTSNVTSTNGGTGDTASATLTVLLPPLIPTLTGWMLALLATLLAAATLLHMRRRRG